MILLMKSLTLKLCISICLSEAHWSLASYVDSLWWTNELMKTLNTGKADGYTEPGCYFIMLYRSQNLTLPFFLLPIYPLHGSKMSLHLISTYWLYNTMGFMAFFFTWFYMYVVYSTYYIIIISNIKCILNTILYLIINITPWSYSLICILSFSPSAFPPFPFLTLPPSHMRESMWYLPLVVLVYFTYSDTQFYSYSCKLHLFLLNFSYLWPNKTPLGIYYTFLLSLHPLIST